MRSVTHGFDQFFSRLGASGAIAATLRPRLYNIPIVSKCRIALGFFHQGFFEPGHVNQAPQIVSVTEVDFLFVREIVPQCCFRNACLEGTFNAVAGRIVTPDAGKPDFPATGGESGLLALERHGTTRIVSASDFAARWTSIPLHAPAELVPEER